jgi:hypothetical protein
MELDAGVQPSVSHTTRRAHAGKSFMGASISSSSDVQFDA